MDKFKDLCTLSNISKSTIQFYVTLMTHIDEGSNDVVIVAPTKASAMRQLNELGENFLSGRINLNKMTLVAPNGIIIHFVALNDVEGAVKGRQFRAIHFRD